MSEKPSNIDKLLELAGFDPAKKPGLTEEILGEALKELQESRKKEALEKARELIKKAVELRQQAYKAEQEFNKQKKKFDDELGKLLNQLRVGVEQVTQPAVGQPAAEEVE
jgi:vacuolar-type H+-ATPase subunit H